MVEALVKRVTEQVQMIKRNVGDPNKLTQREYEASLNALNIFFGAIIGVSLGNIEAMSVEDYVVLLIATATIVSTILIVSYSHRRIWNMMMMFSLLGLAWYVDIYKVKGIDIDFPEKLLPTLSVWAGLAILLEFTEKTPEPDAE
ncbi:hypothetical protein ACR9YC_01980 [Parasphingorhabdus sp. DH2-15]|uniref:hypothetical protein n=1 Tax=Parasphingorhabdus sp. DH2-15 TaxID=3444112 RepID=UPI003F6851A4